MSFSDSEEEYSENSDFELSEDELIGGRTEELARLRKQTEQIVADAQEAAVGAEGATQEVEEEVKKKEPTQEVEQENTQVPSASLVSEPVMEPMTLLDTIQLDTYGALLNRVEELEIQLRKTRSGSAANEPDSTALLPDYNSNARKTTQYLENLGAQLNIARLFGDLSRQDMDKFVYLQKKKRVQEEQRLKQQTTETFYNKRSFKRSVEMAELSQQRRALVKTDHVDHIPRLRDEYVKKESERAELKRKYLQFVNDYRMVL